MNSVDPSRPLQPEHKIYVAGHGGMVGSAIVRKLNAAGYHNIISRSHAELDLTNQQQVADFFSEQRPEHVVLAAAKVGGILANNSMPADFIYQNMMIEANVINAAYRSGVQRLLFLGSSCIYPRDAIQPMSEDQLLTGPLEPTNEPYAIAKIAGIKLCESYNRQYGTHYRSVMPTNLYGPYDNFDLQASHVVPAMIRKFHEAKMKGAEKVDLWGTGTPRREFLHVDDMADASIHVMGLTDERIAKVVQPTVSHLNIGSGEDVTIQALSQLIGKVVGYHGRTHFDTSKPDGTPRKLLDVSKMKQLGWQSTIALEDGMTSSYEWFLANQDSYRG